MVTCLFIALGQTPHARLDGENNREIAVVFYLSCMVEGSYAWWQEASVLVVDQ